MSAPIDVVLENSAAFNRRDLDAMLRLFGPDVVVLDHRSVGWGEFRGVDAVRAYYEGMFDNLAAVHEDMTVMQDEDGVVIGRCHTRARLTEDDDDMAFDYTLRVTVEDGLIGAIEIYDDEQAARAAG